MESTSGAVKNLMRMLECLDFPALTEITVDTLEGIQKIIIWLEDRKIRALDVGDREPLRTLTADWETKVSEYLGNVGCGQAWNPSNRIRCLTWLANYAVSLDYEDNRDELVNWEETLPASTGHDIPALLDRLASVVELSRREDESDYALMQRIARFVRLVLSPEAIAAVSAGGLTDKVINDLPLGFDTSNGQVNKVALVLRLLYLDDFQELQQEFNSLIVLGQEYTANPRTNTSLGKVGR